MVTVELEPSRDIDVLVPLLHEAEEGDERIARAIQDPAMTSYIARSGETVIGAVVMHWQDDESEIVYIATVPKMRGQGYGKALMQRIVDEARSRGTASVCVGTANSSWSNIAFYQKCGFRMDAIRKDFFDYFTSPVYEDGIRIQDMLMLRCTLADV